MSLLYVKETDEGVRVWPEGRPDLGKDGKDVTVLIGQMVVEYPSLFSMFVVGMDGLAWKPAPTPRTAAKPVKV